MTMLPERKSEQPMPPPPAAQAPVEIRRYATVDQFQVDAATMATAGWIVVAQSEASAGLNGAWVGVALIVALIGLLLFWPLLILALLVLILAAVNGRKQLVVTYRPTIPAV